jgi:hypothetical protein
VDEVNRGNIRAEGRLYELKALQDSEKSDEYLTLARTLPGYGDIVFPHCACDSRKEGHVIPTIGMKSFRLHACREDGVMEAQTVELEWDTVTRWESDEESMAFCFQYNRTDKAPRWVKVYTPYVSFSKNILCRKSIIWNFFCSTLIWPIVLVESWKNDPGTTPASKEIRFAHSFRASYFYTYK